MIFKSIIISIFFVLQIIRGHSDDLELDIDTQNKSLQGAFGAVT